MGDVSKYIQATDGSVYKVMEDHMLKLSPWQDGEDRRVVEQEIGDYRVITYKNACMIVNSQFRDTREEWEHRGKKFIASSLSKDMSIEEHAYLLSTLPNHKAIIRDARKLLDKMPDHSLTIESEDGLQQLKMIKSKGKIYYILIINKYLPRVQAYDKFGEFVQWLGIGDCKPIFNMTDKKYM